jgi:adenylate cyclase
VAAGSRKHVVCFFADVRGFTAYSESHPVEEVIAMLNDLLERQTRIILEHRGGIDKFVGDEVMATFEGEDGLDRALRAALDIQAEPLTHAAVSIGIGIHAGEVIQGDIGSRDRKDFTIIGSTVNLAARLCSAAGPGQILVTESVWNTLAGDFEAEALPPLQLKGISEPVPVRDVTG